MNRNFEFPVVFSKQLIQIFCSGVSNLAPFVGNGTKDKVRSEIKSPLKCVLLFSLVPAHSMLRVDLNEMLETRSKTTTAGKSNRYSIKGHNIEFQILQIRPYKVKITKY